jgi:uncharacterized protein
VSSKIVLGRTKNWIKNFVLRYDLCPFAHRPWEEGRLRFEVSLGTTFEQVWIDLQEEVEILRSTPVEKLSNSFLILPLLPSHDFPEFYGEIQRFAERENLEDIQLVAFHPKFAFYGSDPQRREHFVNRSPYAMVHLLRNEEFAAVFKDRPDLGEQISAQNEEKLKSLSESEWTDVLQLLDL